MSNTWSLTLPQFVYVIMVLRFPGSWNLGLIDSLTDYQLAPSTQQQLVIAMSWDIYFSWKSLIVIEPSGLSCEQVDKCIGESLVQEQSTIFTVSVRIGESHGQGQPTIIMVSVSTGESLGQEKPMTGNISVNRHV